MTIATARARRSASTAAAFLAALLALVLAPDAVAQTQRVFVPIVLSTSGSAGAFYTSELTLTNRGTTTAQVELIYSAAFGDGSGRGTTSLAPGRQLIVPDAIAYLRSLNIPIPATGNRGGSLSVVFSGLSSPSAGAVTVRTTTAVTGGRGRAGLSYPAIVPGSLGTAVYVCGLRQTLNDRSNLALMNAGTDADGPVTLLVTIYPGDGSPSAVLPDVTIQPGGFTQLSQVLATGGLSITNGFARIERVAGTAPYYAYGVVNDQSNSDGSFIPPVVPSTLSGRNGLTLPVAVETSTFATELILTNFGSTAKTLQLAFVTDTTSRATVTLRAREQRIIPSFVQLLRDQGAIGPAGPTFAGAVFATVLSGDVSGLAVGARTSSPGGGGRFGLYYSAVPYGRAARVDAWLYGLQQDGENRTNVALVNTGEVDTSSSTFRIEIYDGVAGTRRATADVTLDSRKWTQLSSILRTYAPDVTNAFARVTRLSGTNAFVAYAVINDGGAPGERSDDGAFVAMDTSDDPGQPPILEVSPALVDFGTVVIGGTKELTVTVRNIGGGSLTGLADASGRFSVTANAQFTLGPGQGRSIAVRFTPATAGVTVGTLSVLTNGGNVTVQLQGSGTTIGPDALDVSPSELDFGGVLLNQTRELSATIRNNGSTPLAISSVSVNGGRYTLVTDGAAATLPPNGTRTATVRFAPSAAGRSTGTLTIVSNDPLKPNAFIPLTGIGITGGLVEAELSTDDGSAESSVAGDGLVIVNRLTPPTYPATLRKVRVYFPPGLNPGGQEIELLVILDRSGGGTPAGDFYFSLPTALPAIPSGGQFVDFEVEDGLSVSTGDIYVGFAAPVPTGSVVFAADANGPQQRRAFFSVDDGDTFQGPVVGSNQNPVNILIRAIVTLPEGGQAPGASARCDDDDAPADGASVTVKLQRRAGKPARRAR